MQFAEPNDNTDPALAVIEGALVAIRRSQRRRTLAGRAAANAHGTTQPDGAVYDVLDVVEEAERAGEPATVSTIAGALAVAQPRASKLVAMAVEGGLLRREADQADGRRALLVRTDAGRRVSEKVHASRRAAFAGGMIGWSVADRADFARLLTSFVEGMREP